MKKILALTLLMFIVGTGAFALEWAVGGGGMFNYARTAKTWTYSDYTYGNFEDKDITTRQGFGAFAFLGLGRFWELNLGFMYKNPGTWEWDYALNGNIYDTDSIDISELNELGGTMGLQFGAYFKFPLVMSNRLVLFPTIGMDFEVTIADTDEWWWNDLWVRAGAGLDIFFTDRLFLRGHFLYGVGIVTNGDSSLWWNVVDVLSSKYGYGTNDFISHGLLFKIGVGIMF